MIQRKTKGVENSGEGKTYHKNPSPKTVLDTPHLQYDFPPCSRPVVLLRGDGHRPDEFHFLRPPQVVLEGALYGTFSAPHNRTIRFGPPLRFPNRFPRESFVGGRFKGQQEKGQQA